MSNKQKIQLSRAIANLDADDQLRVLRASDDELPKILEELGISLPASSWWLVALKIILYGLGLVLAGVGTSAAAQTLSII